MIRELHITRPGVEKFTMAAVRFTTAEWSSIAEKDEVLSFHRRVCDRAVDSPIWNENYLYATYLALIEEVQQYSMDKYNDGKPFSIGDNVEDD